MSYTEAAYVVLKRAGRPLHTDEVLERAITEGLLVGVKGKTPNQTMRASLYLENARKKKRGEQTRFTQYPNAVWGLAEWDFK